MPRYREGMSIRDFPGNELLSLEDTEEGTIEMLTLADIESRLELRLNGALDAGEFGVVEDENGPRAVTVTVRVASWNDTHGRQSNG